MTKGPTKNPGTVRFTAAIEGPLALWGGDVGVLFPYNVKRLFGIRDVPVVATVDRHGFRSSIWKRGWFGTHPVLLIPKRIRRRLRKTAGDAVEVCVALDVEQRDVKLAPDFKVALSANRAARAAFKKLHRLRQGEYVDWVNEVEREASRRRRITRAIEMLAEGRPLKWAGGA